MKPITPTAESRIVASFRRVFEKNSIEELNKSAYNFIYLASGFIAHYNMFGFRDAYTPASLAHEILANKRINQWDNFAPSDENYEYYMSKKRVYNRLCELAHNFLH